MKNIKDRLAETRSKLEALGKEVSKAEGRRDQELDQLKAQGLNSLEEAKARVTQMTEEWEATKAEAEALLTEFERDYEAFL